MDTNTSIPASFKYSLILFVIIGLGLISMRMDKSRINPRLAYEKQLHKIAFQYRGNNSSLSIEKKEVDQPDMASLQEYFMTMDPALLRVPAERLNDAIESMKTFRTKTTAYQLNWAGTSTEMGGRTRAIMWDPNDASGKKVWAGGVTGGLWSNQDITSAISLWQPVSDMWPNMVISCITYDPNNPMIFYIGTGESQTALITYRESSGRGVGIWKTTDGGQTFNLLPSTAGFAYVNKIVVRNENGSSAIYAGVVSGIYKGSPWISQPSDGLYRSVNGGSSWEQVLPVIEGQNVPYAPSDVQLGADGRIYVGTIANQEGNGGATILYSDFGTPGTWTTYNDIRIIIETDPVNNKPYRVVIAPAPSESNIVYAAVSAGTTSSTTTPVYKGYYMLRSSDKGNTWDIINTPDGSGDWANLAWHAMDLAVDPNDPATVYAGGLDIWRTNDSGNSWAHLSDWSLMYYGGGDQYIHADQHTIVYKPGSSNTILYGSDGGVFYTETGDEPNPVFIQKNKNFNTLQFYTCAIHPGAGMKKYLGGLQDNGTLYYKGTPLTINDMIDGGDGACCFWDQDEPNLFITSYYYNRYSIFENGNQVSWIDNQSGVFINPADYSSSENALYANGVNLWGANANKILRVKDIPQNGNGSFINSGTNSTAYFSHVKISPYSTISNTKLFFGTVSGRLFKMTNAQAIPQTTEIGSPLFPQANISCIACAGSEDTLLVTFSNYGVSSIWQTCNGGIDWREVEGDLPDMPVRWAIYHPQNSQQAMIATELGVWTTSSLQGPNVYWQPQTSGMANVRVDMLAFRASDNTVLAASHGRGLFTTTFTYDVTTSVKEVSSDICSMYYSTENRNIIIETGLNTQNQCRIRLYAPDGKKLSDQTMKNSGEKISVDIPANYKGILIAHLNLGAKDYSRKILVE